MAGEIRGHTGWFPESYVEPIDVGIPSAAATFVQQDSIEKRTLEYVSNCNILFFFQFPFKIFNSRNL